MMPREIKFRLWNPLGKYFLYFGLYADSIPIYKGMSEETIVEQQYTGLKDENGVEIYEGDIVEDSFLHEFHIVEFGEGETCEGDVYSSNFVGWYLKTVSTKEIKAIYLEYPVVVVVGNIYENPELLNVQV